MTSAPRVPLFLHGTARQRFAPQRSAGPLDEFFRHLEAGVGIHDLADDSVYLCEELVRLQWSLGERQRRAFALLVLATFVAARQGSSRLPLDGGTSGYLGGLVASIVRAGGLEDSPAQLLRDMLALVREARFDSLIGGPGEYKPLIHAHGCIYQERLYACEQRLVARLSRRLAGPPVAPSGDIAAAVADVAARPSARSGKLLQLGDEQRDAVSAALGSRFTVISGGPGTGKTAIITAIVRAAVRLGIDAGDIALAAPTGKATARIADAVVAGLASVADPALEDSALAAALPDARTLHRLLGYMPGPGQFRHHETNPIRAALIVVDEASMIDLVLMERLFRAASDDARLVLLGDADQLPSVDAGAVFRDLTLARDAGDDAAGYSWRLQRSYRMDPTDPEGRAILGCARDVRAGNADALLAADSPLKTVRRLENAPEGGVSMLQVPGTTAALDAFVKAWHQRHWLEAPDFRRLVDKEYHRRGGTIDDADSADLRRLFAIFERSRILTVTRRYDTGADAINRRLHELALDRSTLRARAEFYPGEPVMMRVNDYRRGLFNGDQGVIVRLRDSGGDQHFRVVFRRGDSWAVFPVDAIRPHIEHAGAITVHKSQGSEFDRVAVVLPSSDLPLATRELLYTAMTRARRGVTLVGSTAVARQAVERRIQRFSGLAEALEKNG